MIYDVTVERHQMWHFRVRAENEEDAKTIADDLASDAHPARDDAYDTRIDRTFEESEMEGQEIDNE